LSSLFGDDAAFVVARDTPDTVMPNNEKRVSTRTFVTGRDPLLRLLSVSLCPRGDLNPHAR
jgi:hypothetical protein